MSYCHPPAGCSNSLFSPFHGSGRLGGPLGLMPMSDTYRQAFILFSEGGGWRPERWWMRARKRRARKTALFLVCQVSPCGPGQAAWVQKHLSHYTHKTRCLFLCVSFKYITSQCHMLCHQKLTNECSWRMAGGQHEFGHNNSFAGRPGDCNGTTAGRCPQLAKCLSLRYCALLLIQDPCISPTVDIQTCWHTHAWDTPNIITLVAKKRGDGVCQPFFNCAGCCSSCTRHLPGMSILSPATSREGCFALWLVGERNDAKAESSVMLVRSDVGSSHGGAGAFTIHSASRCAAIALPRLLVIATWQTHRKILSTETCLQQHTLRILIDGPCHTSVGLAAILWVMGACCMCMAPCRDVWKTLIVAHLAHGGQVGHSQQQPQEHHARQALCKRPSELLDNALGCCSLVTGARQSCHSCLGDQLIDLIALISAPVSSSCGPQDKRLPVNTHP